MYQQVMLSAIQAKLLFHLALGCSQIVRVLALPERRERTELTGTAAFVACVSTDSCCSAFHFSIVKVPSEASPACFLIAFKDRCKIPGTRCPLGET